MGGRYSIFRAGGQKSTGSAARDALISLAKEADAVALELAVTAAFLANEGEGDAWDEVASRKPEKATVEYLDKAKALYKRFETVANLPRPLPNIA
jgi:hypothetical protein